MNRIKIAFEEYYNDKGCYPNQDVVDELIKKENCGKSFVFGRWLKPWPCDPDGEAYKIETIGDCPKWFRILATLENKKDPSINYLGVGENDSNYAVSSGNVSPGNYVGDDNPNCLNNGCYFDPVGPDNCGESRSGCEGPNCFSEAGCRNECRVKICYPY